jgi:hypothetical protein
MTIESTKVEVNATQQIIVDFLCDAQNLYHILPQDKISDWKATKSECSFKVQGGFTITLVQNGTDGVGIIKMKSGDKSPFPFNLSILTSPISALKTQGYLFFDGEVNMFLKMMVEKPLTNLFNYMSDKLKSHFENEAPLA